MLTDLAVVPREKPHTGAAAREQPRDSPVSNLKNDRMISVRFQGKPFNITVIQVYVPTSNAEEAERFYEDLQDLLEHPKKMSFSL